MRAANETAVGGEREEPVALLEDVERGVLRAPGRERGVHALQREAGHRARAQGQCRARVLAGRRVGRAARAQAVRERVERGHAGAEQARRRVVERHGEARGVGRARGGLPLVLAALQCAQTGAHAVARLAAVAAPCLHGSSDCTRLGSQLPHPHTQSLTHQKGEKEEKTGNDVGFPGFFSDTQAAQDTRNS